jgi:nanoRNase/pAp phosphatase (c-di-AMP/oligoRNAs hydrolase)
MQAGEQVVDATTDFAVSNPELTLVAVIGVVVLGGLLVVAIQWRLRTPADKFVGALATTDEVSVLMHPNPDPDAMACALAVAALADRVDTDTAMQYPGQIRHQENRAFRTVLDLEVERIEGAAELRDDVVLVDHNEPRGFAGADLIDPYAVVDHHPGGGEGTAFTDVRTDYGACATLLAGYLDDRGWSPDTEERRLPTRLATALLYGIQSDTTNLTRGCSLTEFDACAYLYPGADPDILDRVANPEVDAEVLEVKARAINNRDVDGPYLVSDVGAVDNVDAIAQAADELLRLEGVTVAVVVGDHDGTIHLSGRSRDDRVHIGDTLATAVDTLPDASAGGHARMGGGQVPMRATVAGGQAVGDGGNTEDDVRETLTERLFASMSGSA